MAEEIPEVSPYTAARVYQSGQAAALQGRRSSTAETRTQLGSARTSGNSAASTR